MANKRTRRDFLKVTAVGFAGSAAAEMTPAFRVESGAAGPVEVWMTNEKLRCAQGKPAQWRKAAPTAGTQTVVLSTEKQFQTIVGFGGAFTDAACFTMNRLAPAARAELFHDMFHPSALGLSVCRTCMGASDYSTEVFSYDEGDPDPELQRFSIDHDRKYVLPMLQEAMKVNSEMLLLSSPWSPPGWMKANGSMLGGSMRRKYLKNYAQYFVKFIQAYGAAGVPIAAVTPQNEVDTDQDGRMPACIFPQEYEIEFVRFLGPLLEQNGLKTKIWVLDHNYNLWGRAVCELEDPTLRKYCNDVAWHGYVGNAQMMSRVHDTFPEVGMHWTEGGPDYTSPDYLSDWAHWTQVFSETLRNWCQSITAWNLALDEKGRPNIGPFPCGGIVTIHSETNEITRSGQFWALAHFSKFIRRGAKRLDSQSDAQGIHHVMVENPDGGRVVVLANSADARSVSLQLGDSTMEIPLEKNAVATLTWR
jgi:glucosylceramidase